MYAAMSKQVPAKMRSVIKDALERLSQCKTDENDVNHMLAKSFDNKTFKDILKCT